MDEVGEARGGAWGGGRRLEPRDILEELLRTTRGFGGAPPVPVPRVPRFRLGGVFGCLRRLALMVIVLIVLAVLAFFSMFGDLGVFIGDAGGETRLRVPIETGAWAGDSDDSSFTRRSGAAVPSASATSSS